MEDLLKYLDSLYPLSSSLRDRLTTILKAKDLKKKDFLLKEGRINDKIFFIKSGLLRCYYQKDDQEVSSWFMKEGDIIISVESFFTQQPSHENIQAIEPSQLYFIHQHELQTLYKTYLEFNFIGRVLTEKYYVLSEQRLVNLRSRRADERYQYLLKHHPVFIQRVPSKYLASYLGVSEVYLSRIKGH